jgi:hypothetical protein
MFAAERIVVALPSSPGSVSSGISMTNYSLIKVGNDYVVLADDQCILRVASRRRAAQLISDAVGLLNAQLASEAGAEEPEAPSLHRETPKRP